MDIENRLVVVKGERVGGWVKWEAGVSRCKLLYIEWINNKVLLYSTDNYIQYPMIIIMEKNILEKQNMCVCVCVCVCKIYIHVKLNHFAAQEKLTEKCKSPILQFLKNIDFF